MIRVLAALLLLAAIPAAARDCRPPADSPPGVRVPGCGSEEPRKLGAQAQPAGRPGFVRLPDGTEIRVGGRVRVEARASRPGR